jgi:hypothetical protein
MSIVNLQIPPKGLLKVFETKSVSTGMSRAIPGGATLTIGGMGIRTHDSPPLVPVILTLGPVVAINMASSWLCDKLKRASVGHIRINGVEIEATPHGITKAISECIIEHGLTVPDEEGRMQALRSSLLATVKPDEEIVSSKDAIICLRVPPDVDMEQYVQGSVIQKCSFCQSDVLVAPSTQIILAHGENQIVCMECWARAPQP